MTEEEERRFNGFSPKTLKFLRGLKANNNKAWFQAHKADYNEFVLQPLRSSEFLSWKARSTKE